jgi:hypothetical protein
MHNFEDVCLGYFETKDIAVEKQVCKVLAGLKDPRIRDWLAVECELLVKLAFEGFMTEFCTGFLDENWEEVLRCKLGSMTQGNDTFWDFAICVQAKNLLLINTPSYLKEDQLHHCLNVGMSMNLTLRCLNKKVTKTGTLKEWLMDVKCVNDMMRMERKEFKNIAKQTRDMSCKTTSSRSLLPAQTFL